MPNYILKNTDKIFQNASYFEIFSYLEILYT